MRWPELLEKLIAIGFAIGMRDQVGRKSLGLTQPIEAYRRGGNDECRAE